MWLSLRDPALIRDTWVRSVVTPSYVFMWAGTPWDTCCNDSRHQERRVMQQWYQTMMLVMRVMRSLHVITIMWDSGLYGATGSHQTTGTMCPPGIFQAPNWYMQKLQCLVSYISVMSTSNYLIPDKSSCAESNFDLKFRRDEKWFRKLSMSQVTWCQQLRCKCFLLTLKIWKHSY